ncbi:MAG: hypothetical protein AB7N24_11270 [Dehalococcoidia bacterium]
MTTSRSLASLAHQLQRAVPKHFAHQFDADAFLNGTPPSGATSPQPPAPQPTAEQHPDLLERLWIDLGWLQPGQPLHQANIPQEILETQPGIASVIQHARRKHGLSPEPHATPAAIRSSQFELPPPPSASPTAIRSSQFEISPGPGHQAPGTPNPTGFVSTLESEPPNILESKTAQPETKKPRRRTHCRGLTKTGDPCYAYRMKAGDLCAFHNAKVINEQQWDQAAQQFEPEAIASAKEAVVDLELLPVQLNDNASLLAFTEGIIRLELAGTLPPSTSRRIASYLRIAQRTLPSDSESRLEPSPADHQGRVLQFVHAAPHVRTRLDGQDLRHQDSQVALAQRKREAILQTNHRYAQLQPQRSSRLPALRSLVRY